MFDNLFIFSCTSIIHTFERVRINSKIGADTGGGCTGGTCSEARLKHSIKPFGVSPSGIPIYSWKYKDTDVTKTIDTTKTFIGAMAQDLISLAPNAVCRHSSDGYLRVLYSEIDVDFQEMV